MADEEGSIHYNSFTSAVAVLKESGRGSLLAKLDLKDAYRCHDSFPMLTPIPLSIP